MDSVFESQYLRSDISRGLNGGSVGKMFAVRRKDLS